MHTKERNLPNFKLYAIRKKTFFFTSSQKIFTTMQKNMKLFPWLYLETQTQSQNRNRNRSACLVCRYQCFSLRCMKLICHSTIASKMIEMFLKKGLLLSSTASRMSTTYWKWILNLSRSHSCGSKLPCLPLEHLQPNLTFIVRPWAS